MIGLGIEGDVVGCGHEKLDVDRTVLEQVSWGYRYCETMKGHRNAKSKNWPDWIVPC
jgi:hypothetical protein